MAYDEANKIAQDITGTMIPQIKEGGVKGGGMYYVGYEAPLDISYKIVKILYRFTYSYNDTEVNKSKGKVVLREVSMGSNLLTCIKWIED